MVKSLSALLASALLVSSLGAGATHAVAAGGVSLVPPFGGTAQEWENIPYDSVTAENTLNEMKALQTEHSLFVAVSGGTLEEAGILYIDSDNDASTGWDSLLWSNGAGIDYKVEDGALFGYEDGAWVEEGSADVRQGESFIEIDVARSDIGLSDPGKLRIGYVVDGASMLPEIGSQMFSVDAAAGAVPVGDGRALVVDGNAGDWDGLEPLMVTADGSTSVTANVYDRTLYMLIEGQIDTNDFADGLWEHLFIDTDRDPATGNSSWAWADTLGSDYLVQFGGLFRSNAGGGWDDTATTFAYERSGTGANKIIEWALPLDALGVEEPATVNVAFLTGTLSAPLASGDPASLPLPLSIAVEADGDPSEWEGVAPLFATANEATKVYAHVNGGALSVLIRGSVDTNEFADGIWEHLFIDADRNPETGKPSWAWANTMGSEYLVQFGLLYRSNEAEEWEDTGTVFDYARSGSGLDKVIEWTLPLDTLGLSDAGSANLAFLSNTQSGPDATGDPATLLLKSTAATINMDGQADDWVDILASAVPSGTGAELRVATAGERLYTLVKGEQLNLDNVYYIDSDGLASTGDTGTPWTAAGMDYKVEDGVLYAYENSGWTKRGPVRENVTTETAEMYLYLEDIGATTDSDISVGYMGRGLFQLPSAGSQALAVESGPAWPGGQDIVYPKEYFGVLNNPYMGWVPWARNKDKDDGESYAQPHRTVYAGVSWRELEPVRGQFDWEGIEEKYQFDFWAESGSRINLRLVLDLPTSDPEHMDIPDWLYEALDEEGDPGVWYDTVEIGSGFSPNYNSELLLAEHERMVAAVAERYNDDSRIAYIQLGSLGHWGEWHTWPAGSGVFPTLSISDQYVQHYLNVFTNKKIGMRKPFPIAKDHELGLFNDVFGIKSSTNEWVGWTKNGWAGIGEFVDPGDDPAEKLAASAMPDFWKYSFSGGEFAEGNPEKWLVNGAIMESLRQIRESHTAWLGPSAPSDVPAGSELQRNLDAMHNLMGYRFVLEAAKFNQAVRSGDSVDVSMLWNNKGVAPFYFDWPLELRLLDGSGNVAATSVVADADIRNWLPGRSEVQGSIAIPAGLAAGQYGLAVAILDPEADAPGILLANEGRLEDGSYHIGNVTVQAETGGLGGYVPPVDIAEPGEQLVTAPVVDEETYRVEVAQGIRQVVIPLSALVQASGPARSLTLEGEGFTLEIPYDVLLQSYKAAGTDSGARLTILIEENEKKDVIARAEKDEYAKLAPLGGAYALGIGVRGTDKSNLAITDYAAPLTLGLDGGTNEADTCGLGGVYEITTDGTMEYQRGQCKNGVWLVDVAGPGVYAVVTYDKQFDDMAEGHWANRIVKWLAARHVVTGVSKTDFAPDRSVTRAEFAVMAARALGLEPNIGQTFDDVESDAWYAGYIGSLYAAGIVSGDTTGAFRPNDLITREEMAVLLARAIGLTARTGDATLFRDDAAISSWAADAVYALRQAGYLSGYPDGTLLPQNEATRAEAAQLLQWLLRV
ncbi:S-layer homology domain-containing protein [Paenibacillus sp. strain BS8-2]